MATESSIPKPFVMPHISIFTSFNGERSIILKDVAVFKDTFVNIGGVGTFARLRIIIFINEKANPRSFIISNYFPFQFCYKSSIDIITIFNAQSSYLFLFCNEFPFG